MIHWNPTEATIANGNVIYSDEFCELTEEILRIKRYFFPSLKPKIVYVADIKLVNFDAQHSAKYAERRTWGYVEHTKVYWAADFARRLPGEKQGKTDVIVDVEDGVRKGFTVRDADAFLTALRVVAPISLIIVDNLNVA